MQNINVFSIKQNDTLPSLQVYVKDRGCLDNIIPFDMSGVTACTFSMIDQYGNLKISSASAAINSYSGGNIQYSWSVGDTDTEGKFKAEFELFFSDGNKMTVPTLGVIEVNVLKDVNDA